MIQDERKPSGEALPKAARPNREKKRRPGKRAVRRSRNSAPTEIFAWRGVRRTTIAVLLALNVGLLAVFGAVRGYDAIISHQTRLQMDSMLAQQGVLCGSSVYHTLETCPQSYTLRADGSVQRALAETLLTGDVTTRTKGSTTVWSGDNGTVEWTQAGELTASVELPEIAVPQDADQAAETVCRLLTDAGLELRAEEASVTQDDTGYTVGLQQEIDGTELLGCRLTVSIEQNNLFTFDGMWCTGEIQPLTIASLSNYSAEEMLFRFLSAQSGAGEIVNVQPAYVLSDRSGGRFATIPCWRFTTDNGDFLLNILTGEMVSAESIGADTASDDVTDTNDGQDAASDGAAEAGSETDNGSGIASGTVDGTDSDSDTFDGMTDADQTDSDAQEDLWNAEG